MSSMHRKRLEEYIQHMPSSGRGGLWGPSPNRLTSGPHWAGWQPEGLGFSPGILQPPPRPVKSPSLDSLLRVEVQERTEQSRVPTSQKPAVTSSEGTQWPSSHPSSCRIRAPSSAPSVHSLPLPSSTSHSTVVMCIPFFSTGKEP